MAYPGSRGSNSFIGSGLTRRQMLARSAGLVAVTAIPASVLAACGGGDESDSSGNSGATGEAVAGTITMLNYEGWMGKNQVADFRKKFPKANVKQVYGVDVGSTAVITQIRQSPGEYDMALAGGLTAGHLETADTLEEFDPERVPNLKNIPEFVQEMYPNGIPTDYGRIGYGYRKDLMSETPTSWADLWDLAPKYSQQITFLKYDTDVMGAALKYTGHDGNATDQEALDDARDALIELKPHMRAFLPNDSAKGLIDGTAVMAMTYDYEIANAQKEEPNIEWVEPEEGTRAYMDGWVPLKGTQDLDAVYAFMNFSLEPKIYADFINTTGAAYFMPAAEPYIDPAIKNNPALAFNEEAIKNSDMQKFDDPEGAERRTKAYQEVLAA